MNTFSLKNYKKYIPWIVAGIYILSPLDIIPDWIIGGGWLDDIAMFGLMAWLASRIKKGTQRYARYKGAGDTHRDYDAKQDTQRDINDPYELLGVNRNASKDEIKAAYMELASKYHPDKVQHLGKELQDLAHKKFIAIKKAYDTIIN
jgi:uncharacterized membrane protein YkvA (DUF1232 family)